MSEGPFKEAMDDMEGIICTINEMRDEFRTELSQLVTNPDIKAFHISLIRQIHNLKERVNGISSSPIVFSDANRELPSYIEESIDQQLDTLEQITNFTVREKERLDNVQANIKQSIKSLEDVNRDF
jgi:methyl-accepting chemotaxis protein